jgi:diadenosine tetraphosphate (Ap4A) HIT family hydrolase
MRSDLVEFQKKFRISELSIHETAHWRWSVRSSHCTLGSGILSLKRYAERLSDITPDEGSDLSHITKVIEATLKHVFTYDKLNYLMLMMVDQHVHFHVVPRYSRAIEFAGLTWADKGWPALPDLSAPQYETSILVAIKNKLVSELKNTVMVEGQ